MLKEIVIALLLLSISANAQDIIRVRIEPNEQYEKLMLYSIVGASQNYVANTSIVFGEFEFVIPEGNESGMYRIYFDVNNGGYFDFIYNNEPVSVTFNPSSLEKTAVFDISEENQLYQSYLNEIETQQYKVDSLQYAYFNPDKKQSLKELYKNELQSLNDLQQSFEKASEGKFVHDFIVENNKYNSPEIVETSQEYLEILKNHFFDYIDFSNQYLTNSSFFVDDVIEYVFYLNGSDDVEMDRQLKKEALNRTMQKVGDNYFIRSEILSSLIYALTGQQNVKLVNFLMEEYYSKLPTEFKDPQFIAKIKGTLKTTLGIIAPEISLNVDGQTILLSELNIADKYVVVFWSTTCSHCMVEIPQLYEFTETLENVKVIAVALEENSTGFDEQTKTMINWIHVLGLNKWQNEYASSYNINSTPTYLVLDVDKKIIAKPEELEDVKSYFEGN